MMISRLVQYLVVSAPIVAVATAAFTPGRYRCKLLKCGNDIVHCLVTVICVAFSQCTDQKVLQLLNNNNNRFRFRYIAIQTTHQLTQGFVFCLLQSLTHLALTHSQRASNIRSSSNIRSNIRSSSSSTTELHATTPALRRVVVTGMGITSCLGNTLDEVLESLKEAKSGITFAEEFAELGIKSQVRGIPALTDEDFVQLIPKATLRFCGTNAKYAYIAMDRAIAHSGLKPEHYQGNPRVATVVGQGGTSIPDIVETVEAVQEGGKRWKNKVGPFRVTRSMGSTCSAVLATAFQTQGPSFSISSACSTGAHCIGTGMEQIQWGKADIALCGAGTFYVVHSVSFPARARQ
jgi:Beta-ketoacyl synthase, N-terminal domain